MKFADEFKFEYLGKTFEAGLLMDGKEYLVCFVNDNGYDDMVKYPVSEVNNNISEGSWKIIDETPLCRDCDGSAATMAPQSNNGDK